MSADGPTRKLASIVALDIAGYSARTEADEARAIAEVATLAKDIGAIAARHGGRVFNTAGDGFMLEFGSSLAAVEAAVELADSCDPKVRVGVHLGDVVVQPNGDLLGHGVNVAARLMARSEPGSVLVSADVRRTIRGDLADRLVSLGHLQLAKMSESIEAYSLGIAASAGTPAPAPRTETLLAVLPFDNLSDDPEMQFFSDGVSEEIIQRLSRGAQIKVIGRASSFQFRDRDKNTRKVTSELGCTHILDGSIRRAGGRVRVMAHLGLVDEAYLAAETASLSPRGPEGDILGPDGYRTGLLFHAVMPELRNDARFVPLCARFGLVAYWLETDKWPDCVDEVPYDFRAACEEAATIPTHEFGY